MMSLYPLLERQRGILLLTVKHVCGRIAENALRQAANPAFCFQLVQERHQHCAILPAVGRTRKELRMAESDTILQLGIEAAREGNREEARNLFGLLTRQEPNNAQAWLWLAGVADGPEQRRAALERVVELDPTNEMAI